jgi:hypothetical protein
MSLISCVFVGEYIDCKNMHGMINIKFPFVIVHDMFRWEVDHILSVPVFPAYARSPITATLWTKCATNLLNPYARFPNVMK